MNGKRSRRPVKNWEAAHLVATLMADRGWFPVDVERESAKEGRGHPMRQVSRRSIYRVVNEGYVPTHPIQFEIAAVFGLLPSHLWGTASLPAEFAYLTEAVAA